MIKLKKIVAVTMAAAMCMGLGMTASAENAETRTPSFDGIQYDSTYYYNGAAASVEEVNNIGETNSELKTTAIEARTNKKSLEVTMNSINTKQEVVDILEANGVIGTNNKGENVALSELNIIPVASADIYHLNADGNNYLTFTLKSAEFDATGKDSAKYTTGDTVVAMLESGEGTGVWRVETGVVDKDGKVTFEADTTGAVIVIKAMKNGQFVMLSVDESGNPTPDVPPVIIPDPEKPVVPTPDQPGTSTNPANGQNANANGAANANGTWTSPKTGEF